jgi:hypothetical protein
MYTQREGAESSTTTHPDATAENEAQERASQTLYTRKVSQDEHIPREEKNATGAYNSHYTSQMLFFYPCIHQLGYAVQVLPTAAYSDIQGVWQMHTQIETNYMELPDRVVLP